MTRPIQVALVDDHALVRDGLRALLSLTPHIRVVGEAESAHAALELLAHTDIDLFVVDIGLKDLNGLELTRCLTQQAPKVRVLILSMYDNREYVRNSIHAGAHGYVLKEASAREITAAIEAIAAGGHFYSPEIAHKLADQTSSPSSLLTPRETQILQMLAQGLDSKAMARSLAISVRTVETHRLSIRRKLQVDSPAALLKYALNFYLP